MCRIRGSVIAILACAGLLFAGGSTEVEVSPHEVPRLVVTTMRAIPGMVQIGDSISDSNAHMVIAYLKPPQGERIELTRYAVVPGEPAEWVAASWEDYRFEFQVSLQGPTEAISRVITTRDGTRLTDQSLDLMIRPKVRNSEDPEVLRDRLDYVEKRYRAYSDLLWRVRMAEIQPVDEHWLDAHCTLEDNRWNLTNEWVARELDYDLVRAQYPTQLSPDDDLRAEEFFTHWREGDRLFAYTTPVHHGGHREGGYIIARGCRVVEKLKVIRY